jgi:hypothetical protein
MTLIETITVLAVLAGVLLLVFRGHSTPSLPAAPPTAPEPTGALTGLAYDVPAGLDIIPKKDGKPRERLTLDIPAKQPDPVGMPVILPRGGKWVDFTVGDATHKLHVTQDMAGVSGECAELGVHVRERDEAACTNVAVRAARIFASGIDPAKRHDLAKLRREPMPAPVDLDKHIDCHAIEGEANWICTISPNLTVAYGVGQNAALARAQYGVCAVVADALYKVGSPLADELFAMLLSMPEAYPGGAPPAPAPAPSAVMPEGAIAIPATGTGFKVDVGGRSYDARITPRYTEGPEGRVISGYAGDCDELDLHPEPELGPDLCHHTLVAAIRAKASGKSPLRAAMLEGRGNGQAKVRAVDIARYAVVGQTSEDDYVCVLSPELGVAFGRTPESAYARAQYGVLARVTADLRQRGNPLDPALFASILAMRV